MSSNFDSSLRARAQSILGDATPTGELELAAKLRVSQDPRVVEDRELRLEALRVLAEAPLGSPASPERRADRVQELGEFAQLLAELDRDGEAIAVAREALARARALADGHPEPGRRALVDALDLLGCLYADHGLDEQALELTGEALDEARKLDDRRRLAGVLNNFGNRLGALGRSEAALEIARETVALYEQLEAEAGDAGSFTAALALARTNLGVSYAALGRHDEALAASRAAVDAYRSLAERDPGKRPALARALNNLGAGLAVAGREQDALACAEEAVAHYREALAGASPWATRFELAGALDNLASRLFLLGREDEHFEPLEQAAEHWRALAEERDHGALVPALARARIKLGERRSRRGELEAAVASSLEAAELLRGLVAEDHEAYAPLLGRALMQASVDLSSLDRDAEALAASEEAVAIYRELVAIRPEDYESRLAWALDNLGDDLELAERNEHARAAKAEAVELYRGLVAREPEEHREDLITALTNLAIDLHDRERFEEARALAVEAEEQARILHGDEPEPGAPALARVLDARGVIEAGLGEDQRGLELLCEALELLVPPPEDDPEAELIAEIAGDIRELCEDAGLAAPEQLRPWIAETRAPITR